MRLVKRHKRGGGALREEKKKTKRGESETL
jgi:hypothetical protein